MSNAHARVKHRKVMKGKMKTVTESCSFNGYLQSDTEKYKRRKEWLSCKGYLTEAQALHLEFMNQNKPILIGKKVT
jgi:hypothetical protein